MKSRHFWKMFSSHTPEHYRIWDNISWRPKDYLPHDPFVAKSEGVWVWTPPISMVDAYDKEDLVLFTFLMVSAVFSSNRELVHNRSHWFLINKWNYRAFNLSKRTVTLYPFSPKWSLWTTGCSATMEWIVYEPTKTKQNNCNFFNRDRTKPMNVMMSTWSGPARVLHASTGRISLIQVLKNGLA